MKKVMVFGTFDKLHPGHLSFLKQAKRKGDFLIVTVARDKNVLKIKNKQTKENERKRLANIKKIEIVDQASLGQIQNQYKIIDKYKPDIICLGYDQKVDIDKLKLVFKGKIYRLKSYKPQIYKSSLR